MIGHLSPGLDRPHRRLLAGLLVIALGLSACGAGTNGGVGASSGFSAVTGVFGRALGGRVSSIGPAPDSQALDLVFELDTAGRPSQSQVRAVSDPTSPSYGHFKSIAWLAQHFGASLATKEAVTSALARVGADAQVDPTGSVVVARLTVAQAGSFFSVRLGLVRKAGGAVEVSPDRPLRLPKSLIGRVTQVEGLPAVYRASGGSLPYGTPLLGPPSGAPEGCRDALRTGAFMPNQIATAFGFAKIPSSRPPRVNLAVIGSAPVEPAEIDTYDHCFEQPAPSLTVERIGIPPVTGGPVQVDTQEASLDLEVISSLDSRLKHLIYIADDDSNLSVKVIQELAEVFELSRLGFSLPQVVSTTEGFCESDLSATTRAEAGRFLAFMALAGISFIADSGDTGSNACGRPSPGRSTVDFPASAVYATGVGGTDMVLDSSNHISTETAWDEPSTDRASGGGFSASVSRPWYQSGIDQPGQSRAVPDVSMYAGGQHGYAEYCTSACGQAGWFPIEGTSLSTQILAAGVALVDQYRMELGHSPLGFLNPLLYALAGSSSPFWVITTGTNDLGGIGCCQAGSGYSPVTGLGSVDLAALARASISVGG